MNYAEEEAFWYLRLNGFFPIQNFVVHKSGQIDHTTDCDVLGIRPPFVEEEVGGRPDDWDPYLLRHVIFGRFIGVICEVKSGRYDQRRLFRPNVVEYGIRRLGLVQREEVSDLAGRLVASPLQESRLGVQVVKLLVARDPCEGPFLCLSLQHVRDFIAGRINKYPKEKYRDRIYFGSILFQHLIASQVEQLD